MAGRQYSSKEILNSRQPITMNKSTVSFRHVRWGWGTATTSSHLGPITCNTSIMNHSIPQSRPTHQLKGGQIHFPFQLAALRNAGHPKNRDASIFIMTRLALSRQISVASTLIQICMLSLSLPLQSAIAILQNIRHLRMFRCIPDPPLVPLSP